KFPKSLVQLICLALLVANTINIAADLSGMADASQILTGLPSTGCIVFFGFVTATAIVKFCYYDIARILKWLTIALFAYVVTAFLVHPGWLAVIKASFAFSIPQGKEMWETIVAILGTTISPYLFFWQAAQEVEEEKGLGRETVA